MLHPALEISGVDTELLAATVDDYAPTAAEQHDSTTTYFFTSGLERDRAGAAIVAVWPDARITSREIDDDDWARRSQQNLKPITVGRITVCPSVSDLKSQGSDLAIVIVPSMGFGTGHHATTRLCLAALQTLHLQGKQMLDIGTGSGVLAIAARLLGAASATGVDHDADAIHAANENLEANPKINGVRFVTAELRNARPEPADIVTANLMGALLVQTATLLLSLVRPGGTLIVSGLLEAERDDVVGAFVPAAALAWEQGEDGWLALAFYPRGQVPAMSTPSRGSATS